MQLLEQAYFIDSELSTRLDLFEKVGDKYHFRCPACGDSKKSKYKKRGSLSYPTGSDTYIGNCYNCGIVAPLGKFIQDYFPDLYGSYKFSVIKNNKNPINYTRKVESKIDSLEAYRNKEVCSKLAHIVKHKNKDEICVSNLNKGHPCREYLKARRLSKKDLERCFYIPSFKKYIKNRLELFESKSTLKGILRSNDCEGFLSYCCNPDGSKFAITFRTYNTDERRFFILKFKNHKEKSFGLETLNKNNDVFIVEGFIDSFMLPNCCARLGGDIYVLADKLIREGYNPICVYDNEPRSKDTKNRIREGIKQGHSIVVYDSSFKMKDINDELLKGNINNKKELVRYLKSRTFTGFKLQLEFNKWVR